jgi:hypothetical protein
LNERTSIHHLNQTLRSAVGDYKVDKDRVKRADVMLNTLFSLADNGFSVETSHFQFTHSKFIVIHFIFPPLLGLDI